MQPLEITILGIWFFVILYIGYKIGKFVERKQAEKGLQNVREDAIKKSRSVLAGQFSEQIAPYLPDFPYKPTESRFIGKPIDFIVFEGMDEGDIKQIAFVEVKSGNSSLSSIQKSLRQAVENKKVAWHQSKVPKEVTNEKSGQLL